MAKWSDALRHASDESELEVAYETVLKLLDDIYASYYDYHTKATKAANDHPIRIAQERSTYEGKLHGLLGLAEVGVSSL